MLARRSMAAFSLSLTVAVSAVSTLSAQTTQPVDVTLTPSPTTAPVAGTEEVPNARFSFVGVVTGNNVNVRCGAADSYYPTMQLAKGERVVVVGHKFDWLKIVPPKGSFSYIAKSMVQAEPGGKTAVVTHNDVSVKAGSLLNQLKVQQQMKLNNGDKVSIIGEAEEYYKISPPEGAYLFISKRFVEPVRQATPGETVPPVESAPATRRSHTGATPEITPLDRTAIGGGAVTGAEAATPATDGQAAAQGESTELVPGTLNGERAPGAAAAAGTGSAGEELAKLNADLAVVQKQPIGERPLTDLRKSYESLAARADAPGVTRRAAQRQADVLRILEQQQNEVVAARKDASEFRAKQAEYENQRRQIETRMKQVGVAVYTAIGELQSSSIQQGGQPLYRLVDPADQQTVVYIRTNDPAQIKMVGQYVGVRGEVVSDQQLSVKVISPMVLEVVDAAKVMRPGGATALYYPASVLKGRTIDIQGAATQPAK